MTPAKSYPASWLPCRGSCRRLRGQRKRYETLNVRQSRSVMPAPSGKRGALSIFSLEADITKYAGYVHSEVYRYCLPSSLRSKWRLTTSLRRYAPSDVVRLHTSWVLPRRGNAVKLRICVSRYDSASGDRLLKFLRVLRLLRFSECANRC